MVMPYVFGTIFYGMFGAPEFFWTKKDNFKKGIYHTYNTIHTIPYITYITYIHWYQIVPNSTVQCT